MDSNLDSPPVDNGDTKTTFRKPSNDTANRKYRRHSPVSGSSSSNGSPMRDHSSSPKFSREDPGKVSEHRPRKDDGRELDRVSDRSYYGRSSNSYRHSDRQSSRSSHGYYRHDDYIKYDKYANDEERTYQKSTSRSGRDSRGGARSDHIRSRDYSRHLDKYSKYDGPGHMSKDKDRERESLFLENQKYKEKDSSSERVVCGRRHGHFEDMEGEKDRYMTDKDVQDEKKDYRRSSGDYRSERRDDGKHHIKEGYKSDLKEMDDESLSKEQRKKYDDKETNRSKVRIIREPSERSEDKDILRCENQESTAKRPKLFSLDKDIDGRKDVSKFTTTADGRESSSSKQVTLGKTQANDADFANDINAAKVAAMKAAELVNRNLVGGVGPVGCMTADQKKKLLWGSKKNTTAEEAGHRWDTALFSDRERQEKFNKLMGVKGDLKVDHKPDNQEGSELVQAEKQKELHLDLEKQYTAGLRRRDGRTVGLGL